MKKSVIIAIGIIYMIAIIVVGFFGSKMKIYNPQIYATEIICKNSEYLPSSPEDKGQFDGVIEANFDENLTVLLNCVAYPENTTSKSLSYSIESTAQSLNLEENVNYKITVNEDYTASVKFQGISEKVNNLIESGKISSFPKRMHFKIVVRTNDGSNKSLTIILTINHKSK